ncbi:hypothetical protein Tco_0050582, partial [Tanacetum coccineum]
YFQWLPFVSTVPGQMTHLVASITLGSARSCVVQSAFLTQGTTSTVISVGVTVVVIIVAVVVVVESSSVVKLSFAVTFPSILQGWAKEFYQDRDSSIKLHCLAIGASLGLVVLLVFAILAACASRAVETL